jgi:ribosomal-protein-alanine N-acetyltransferase
MHDIQIIVRPARTADVERIMQLRDHARRVVMHFGYEDLMQMVRRGNCLVAYTGPLLWGFACTSSYQKNLSMLRGLGLINGWRIDDGLTYLLRPLEDLLLERDTRFLMHLAVDMWLSAPLMRQGFVPHDYIIHFERAAPLRPMTPDFITPDVILRALGPHEITALTLLDHQAFDWPWQFSSGELVKWLMTADRLVVLEREEQLVGYSCVQVHGENAQIVRLAVAPQWQGHGYGRYLLADALDFAAGKGVMHITLNTQWHNVTSQRLYKGFGFRAIGRRIPVLIRELGEE